MTDFRFLPAPNNPEETPMRADQLDVTVMPAIPPAPAELKRLDPLVPIIALAALVHPGSPRWSYAVWAVELVGPLRGAPYLRREVAHNRRGDLDSVDTLRMAVEYADGLAGQQPAGEPDCDDGLVCPMPSTKVQAMAPELLPVLRWPVLAVRPPWGDDDVPLAGVPRAARPALRGADVLDADGRLTAMRCLIQHARWAGFDVDISAVHRLVGWCCGLQASRGPARAEAASWRAPAGEDPRTSSAVESAGRALVAAASEAVAAELLR